MSGYKIQKLSRPNQHQIIKKMIHLHYMDIYYSCMNEYERIRQLFQGFFNR